MNDTTTATRFRKKPLLVDAIRFDGTNHAQVEAFAPGCFRAINPADRGDDPDIVARVYDQLHSTWIGVKTGHWIVKGTRSKFYPIADDVFTDTYENADALETFAWGQTIGSNDAGATVDIPVNRDDDWNWIGIVRLPLADAVVLRDMLDGLVSETQQVAELAAGND